MHITINVQCELEGQASPAEIPVTIEQIQSNDIVLSWAKDGTSAGNVDLTWQPDGLPRIVVAFARPGADGQMQPVRLEMCPQRPTRDGTEICHAILLEGES
jgi:hypothetical protein